MISQLKEFRDRGCKFEERSLGFFIFLAKRVEVKEDFRSYQSKWESMNFYSRLSPGTTFTFSFPFEHSQAAT
jgi:hypothetical protein